MKRRIYFDVFDACAWPPIERLKPYFFAPKGKEWSYRGGNDNWAIRVEGAEGSEKLDANQGRIDIDLEMWGHPDHGVCLIYSKWGGGHKETYSSKGNLLRLREIVHGLQGTPLPIGLFIPFQSAWLAVKEFMDTDGALPKSIEWIANRDLPPNTFPDP
jgi:hypothetical protein